MYKKLTLDNGLRIIAHPMPKMQSAAVGIWIKVGGRYETFASKGISHYMEHLLFKGSKKYSCRQIKESIEGVGGALNGFTSEELTCYLAKMPARHLATALDILSDMVKSPLLDPAEVEKERTVILEELKMYKDQPQSYVYDLLDELLWPQQPLGASIIGTVESVGGISRDGLAAFKDKYYTPVNIVISAAGKLDFDLLVSKAKKVFFKGGKGPASTFLAVKEEQSAAQLKLLPKATEQIHLALGFHGFKRGHPLRHALGLLNVILGGNMSSRLFNEVREKRGLAYEIGTLAKRFQDTGAFIVHAGIDNRKVEEALPLILAELAKSKDDLVSIDEFKRAKEFYLGQLLLALEDTLDHMLWLGESVAALNKPYTLEEIIKQVNQVKREDLREAARQVFKEPHLNASLIGPLEGRQPQIQDLLRLK